MCSNFTNIIIYLLFIFKFFNNRDEEGVKTDEKTQVGFEPGTLRSLGEHCIGYATEARPILVDSNAV